MSTVTDHSPSAFQRAKDEVAEKVRKLLAQAEDPAATPEEAQTFTVKAQQLMTKYSIDLAMVTDSVAPDQVVARSWTIESPYAVHKVSLVNAVARANDCRAIYAELPGGRKLIEVVGHPSDLEWVETLSRSLEVQLAAALAAAMVTRPPGVHGRTFAVGFVQGFASEVARRLHQARQDAVATAAADHAPPRPWPGAGVDGPSAPPSVALVLVAKAQRVEEEFTIRHPRARTVYRQTRLRSWSGYSPGRAAGRRATLARGSIGGARRSLGG